MAQYVVPAPVQPSVPVVGGGAFPVRRIFCVGRNYVEHALEMGGNPEREPPFFFTKPADAVVTGGADMPYPPQTANLHHEMELVVAIGTGGTDIPVEQALAHVFGYAAGIDMTRRDMQNDAKATRRPWDMSKGFDHSAPISDIVPASALPDPTQGQIVLSVNGVVRQDSDLSKLIWSVAETVAALSSLVAIAPGDLIYTGTPAGVGAVQRGDVMEGTVAGVGTVRTRVV